MVSGAAGGARLPEDLGEITADDYGTPTVFDDTATLADAGAGMGDMYQTDYQGEPYIEDDLMDYDEHYDMVEPTSQKNILANKQLALENKVVTNSGTKNNLLGTVFFKDYITVIDLQEEKMFVSRNADVAKNKDEIRKFPVDIQPDYKTRELMISNIWEQHSNGSNFENETKVLKINDTDVSSFTKEQLCQFWDNDWKTLRALDQLELVIETSEGTSKFSIKKENLLSTNS